MYQCQVVTLSLCNRVYLRVCVFLQVCPSVLEGLFPLVWLVYQSVQEFLMWVYQGVRLSLPLSARCFGMSGRISSLSVCLVY